MVLHGLVAPSHPTDLVTINPEFLPILEEEIEIQRTRTDTRNYRPFSEEERESEEREEEIYKEDQDVIEYRVQRFANTDYWGVPQDVKENMLWELRNASSRMGATVQPILSREMLSTRRTGK